MGSYKKTNTSSKILKKYVDRSSVTSVTKCVLKF